MAATKSKKIHENKNGLALWENYSAYDGQTWWNITDDGCGICNSIEEMCSYYNDGDEVGLVNEILVRGNEVTFEDHGETEGKGEYTYDEYLEQINGDGNYIIFHYVSFTSYEKAKEIWDLLNE